MTEATTLFRTPQAALVFAFNYSMQQQGRPLMDRLAAPAARAGKGLSGMDGAGQAGMIRREISNLSRFEEAAMIARFAPRTIPCSCRSACCAGYRLNPDWDYAIATLEGGAQSVLSGHVSHYRLRRKLVEQVFGVKVVLKDLAEQCGVHPNTATEHRRLIRLWISGDKARHEKSGREAMPAVDGIESAARKKIDSILSARGLIGDEA
ncbi:DNA-binding protein [Paraburkholderia aromaticivorans]|uniref:DNA-binding protein n=1 Tax=Paraburkholderia aromaticivorans TaxID=2026199 RepID=UPI00145622F4|nr:DNA-binding protein [Paraburkholderia aromaticivorans]